MSTPNSYAHEDNDHDSEPNPASYRRSNSGSPRDHQRDGRSYHKSKSKAKHKQKLPRSKTHQQASSGETQHSPLQANPQHPPHGSSFPYVGKNQRYARQRQTEPPANFRNHQKQHRSHRGGGGVGGNGNGNGNGNRHSVRSSHTNSRQEKREMIIKENIMKKKREQNRDDDEYDADPNNPDDDKMNNNNNNNGGKAVKKLPNRKKLVIIAVGDSPLPGHAAFDFIHCRIGMEKKVNWKHYHVMVLIVPTNTPSHKKETMFEACKKAKKINPKLFVCIIDIEASESAVFRSKCFNYGANMVTNDHHSLKQVLNIIGNKGFNGRGKYICPYCGMQELTEDELWHHVPLYHVNDTQSGNIQCPICQEEKRKNYLLHLRNNHGPVMRGEIAPEYRDGILTHAFALVVVRRPTDSKFLVVQEAANSGFWLPGGRVEVGETLLEAAIRETKEEAGIDVDIKGVLKVEHSTYAFDERKKAYNRMRVIFYAEPCDEKELPKSVPNYDSAGATFISVDELDEIVLRADEPREWFNSLTQNFYYYPLDILSCWKHDHRSANHPGQYFIQHNNNNNDDDRDRDRERGLMSNHSSANKHAKNGAEISDAVRDSGHGDHVQPSNNKRAKPVMAVHADANTHGDGDSPESENTDTDYSSSFPSYPSNPQDEGRTHRRRVDRRDATDTSEDDEHEHHHGSNSSREEDVTEDDDLDDDDDDEMEVDEDGDIEHDGHSKRQPNIPSRLLEQRRSTDPVAGAKSPFVHIGPQQAQHAGLNALSPSSRHRERLPSKMDTLQRTRSDDTMPVGASPQHSTTPSRKAKPKPKDNRERERERERQRRGDKIKKPSKSGKPATNGVNNLPRQKTSMKAQGAQNVVTISPHQGSAQTINAPQQVTNISSATTSPTEAVPTITHSTKSKSTPNPHMNSSPSIQEVPTLPQHTHSAPDVNEIQADSAANNNNSGTPTSNGGNTNPNQPQPSPPQPNSGATQQAVTYIVATGQMPIGVYPQWVPAANGMYPPQYASNSMTNLNNAVWNYEPQRISSNVAGLPIQQQMEKQQQPTSDGAQQPNGFYTHVAMHAQHQQYQGYPPFAVNGQHPQFWANGQGAQRNSQSVYIHAPPTAGIYTPQGIVYPFPQQQQPQQQQDAQSQTQSQQQQGNKDSKSDVQFNNVHNNQQPKPELRNGTKTGGPPTMNRMPSRHGMKSPEVSIKRPKSSKNGKNGKKIHKTTNKSSVNNNGRSTPKSAVEINFKNDRNNAKKKKNHPLSTQSDSLLRKKKHRRSLSSGVLPDPKLQHHHFAAQHNSPPPGPMYPDEINQKALLAFAD